MPERDDDVVEVGEATRAALVESAGWISAAQRELGEIYADYARVQERLEVLGGYLRRQAAVVRECEAQHAKILGILIDSMGLPSKSHWIYDPARGAFVKKETSSV